MTPSRSLTFAVGTSLLTASLVSAGCKPPIVNTVPEEPHVNEGPEPETPDAEEPQVEEPQVEEPQVEEPDAEEPDAEEPQVEEPRTVNVRHAPK